MTEAEAFGVLGLPPTAEWPEIRAAYHARARDSHPDTGRGDREQFARVSRAYQTLRATEDARAAARRRCVGCDGIGRVAVRYGWRVVGTADCPDCGGTGRKARG